MATLALTTENKDRITLKAFGCIYSNASAEQQALIDGTGTSAGESKAALSIVQQAAQWITMAGLALAPDNFEAWFVSETVLRLVASERPERVAYFREERDAAREAALTTYIPTEANVAALQGQTFTYQTVRTHVVDHCVRRKPVVYPSIASIDAATLWAMLYIWNRTGWNFRRRWVIGSIATDETITFSSGLAAGETFDSFAIDELYCTDVDQCIRHTVGNDMQWVRSLANQPTGRPIHFRVQRQAASTIYQFYPVPDAAYQFRSEVWIKPPAAASSATDATPFNLFPTDFQSIIRDLALSKVLRGYDPKMAATMWETAISQLETMAPQYDDRGAVDDQQQIRDVYRDMNYITGASQDLGGSY